MTTDQCVTDDSRWHQWTGSGLNRWAQRCRVALEKSLSRILLGGDDTLKRGLDLVAATLALLVLSPVFLVVATLVKLTDRGPILFWQKRVGENGRLFAFPKFRSMCINAEKIKDELLANNDHGDECVTFKMKQDPRVTWIGRIIRRFSIDELPQLWCVFRGDMSLVGPRPPVPREVEQYNLRDRQRLGCIPGLTCIWQVSGRGDVPFPEQVEMDLDYIRNRNFLLDIKLILLTIPAVLTGKGAY
jgi:lipopolysaccharide/colanic/teichoic acid biosynthesis glycosyltransferase